MTDIAQISLLRKREAEWSFISAAYSNPGTAIERCSWLRPEQFLDVELRSFWQSLIENKDCGQAAGDAGNGFIHRLAVDALYMPPISGEALVDYANRLSDANWMFSLSQRMPDMAMAIADGDKEKLIDVIRLIQADRPQVGEIIPDASDVALDFISGLQEEDHTIFTGTPIDQAMGGLWRSSLTVLCARPSIGKTALGFQIARNVAASKKKALFISMEMGKRALWARASCGVARVPYRDILAKRASDEEVEKVIEATRGLIDAYRDRLLIDDRPQTTSDLWRKVAALEPDLVVVDHIRLFSDLHASEVKRQGIITWALKRIAKEFDIAVLALAQLNRNMEKREADERRPTLSDLRDSGEIEENADNVLGLHRDRIYLDTPKEKSPAELLVMKFRDGPANIRINLTFDGLGQWFETKLY